MRSFASRRPDVTRESNENPKTPTTMIDKTRVVAMTRKKSERRHIRLTHRGRKRRTCIIR
jgi:hypothetical protein